MKRTTWFVFFLLSAVSCLDEPDCFRLNNSAIGIVFRKFGITSEGRLASVDETLQITSVKSPQTEDGFVFANKASTTFYLGLSVLDEDTQYLFEGAKWNKSLTIGYNRQLQFVSEDCGERYIFSDIKVLETTFDSVRIVNNTPGDSIRNIEIYSCPQNDKIGIQFKLGSENQGEPMFNVLNKDVDSTLINFEGGKNIVVGYNRALVNLGHACGGKTFFYNLKLKTSEQHIDTVSTKFLNRVIADTSSINLEITVP